MVIETLTVPPETVPELIDMLGGSSKVARDLSLKQSRVSNWKGAELISVSCWGLMLTLTKGKGLGLDTIEDYYKFHGHEIPKSEVLSAGSLTA